MLNSRFLFILPFCFAIVAQDLSAQKVQSATWKDTSPVHGVDSVWKCLQNDGWTDEEKMILTRSAWQVMIHVDTLGRAKVVDVIGISNSVMRQKLLDKTCLGPFIPRMKEATALPAFYFLYHSARDQLKQVKEGPEAYEKFNLTLEMADLEEVTYRSMGIDFFVGAYVPVFAGKASSYLSPGVGASFGIGIRFLQHYSFNASIAFATHWVATEIPDTRDVEIGSSVGNFGALFLLSRDIDQVSFSVIGGLTEVGLAPANRNPKPRDEESIYGFTSGLRVDVPVWTFMEAIGIKNGGAFRRTTSIDVMAGIRYNYFEHTEMRGWMVETGVNYRWRIRDIDTLRPRNSFYER